MGILSFLKGLKKKKGSQNNANKNNSKYDGLTIEELYFKGKSNWLAGNFDEALEFFKAGIDKQDNSDPYSYACLAMYYYEIASKGSENDDSDDFNKEEYDKMVSWAGAHVKESSTPDILVLYSLGDVAAKLGTKESESSLNPFYEAMYRYLGLLLYDYITGGHQELTKMINKHQEEPVFKRQASLVKVEKVRSQKLFDSQREELTQLTKGNLKENGLIRHLLVDVHNYSENEFKQLQKSFSKENILVPLIIFCSLISEARLKGLEGLK
ncbi:hypothetical protein [Selenihalanaerobacter shriftii]|uniref:Tetratricopeptide repeat-containing protein n=1 Tax=Selenihalanaerobacter shriftii TaxID=142842 RepID=A0A1T4KDL5_9FIRM|nr:hypothetical protein [Selenihalanaerobacter shriftii]SJZ40548.1 hypothetical protein SAMN02745118_00735 [Selenihalanaerobacter shriftii]